MTSSRAWTWTRARVAWVVVFATLLGLSIHRYGRRPASPATFAGDAFGTTYVVKLGTAPADAERGAVESLIQAALDGVDATFSTYRADSELSRLNRHPVHEPFAASPELRRLLLEAKALHARTGGAFDVTVGPLVAAWGFGADGATTTPTPADLERLRTRVGMHHLDVSAGAVTKRAPITLDLSAFAKGHAVDVIAAALVARGHGSFMVEVGGEVWAQGRKPDGGAWRIGIEVPIPGRGGTVDAIDLDGQAIATSGTYRNQRVHHGEPRPHVIDPRTGQPVGGDLVSVSVVAGRASLADGLATALLVMGDRGRAFAEREGVAVSWLRRGHDGALRSEESAAFTAVRGGGARPSADGAAASSVPLLLGATVGSVALAMVLMGLGTMLGGRRLQGSCGGTGGSNCVCSATDRRRCARTAAMNTIDPSGLRKET